MFLPEVEPTPGLDDRGARPDVVSNADPLGFRYTQKTVFWSLEEIVKKCRNFLLSFVAALEMTRDLCERICDVLMCVVVG